MSSPVAVPVSPEADTDFDVLIVGSGFGGSVTAMRLTEKGYRVGVLEAGRRFADEEFAETSWDLRKFLWAPMFKCFGIQRIHLLSNCMILAGAGVGGGSLNYANTLYVPPDPFFNDPQWKGITDWRAELSPHYEQAQRMLGVVKNPTFTDADRLIKEVADDMGAGDTFVATPVGVYFGPSHDQTVGTKEPGVKVPDPYFGGAGPDRVGCTECGSCMTGCRVGAKNTLVKNYLGLAESNGAQVIPLTTVTAVQQGADGVWRVSTKSTGRWVRKQRKSYTAKYVVLAAGTWGTQNLLFKMKDKGLLPKLSQRLGVLTRTNSESIVGAGRLEYKDDLDLTHGVAITSSFHPTGDTHIEPVRYGKGSNAMGLLQTLMTDGDGPKSRWRQLIENARADMRGTFRMFNVTQWSERTVIALVMQHLDNSITTFTKKTLFWRRLDSKQGHGEPNPTWIPAGNEATRRLAAKIDGVAGGTWGELFNIPLTAHFLGGAVIGTGPENGVIDPYHRVYGYPSMYVVDGAAISANLGVNPSLSITAQAERAASLWPNKGETDLRPEQGLPYQRMAPVPPSHPVVPAGAPGALRHLPIEPVRSVS